MSTITTNLLPGVLFSGFYLQTEPQATSFKTYKYLYFKEFLLLNPYLTLIFSISCAGFPFPNSKSKIP